MSDTKDEQSVAGGRDIAWLKGRVKKLEESVATLERDSHPPVDLRPAVTAIVAEVAGAAAVGLDDARDERGTRSVQRVGRRPNRGADENAWDFVRAMKEEWAYEDWEDFYEGIKGAMEKIAARHRPPTDV